MECRTKSLVLLHSVSNETEHNWFVKLERLLSETISLCPSPSELTVTKIVKTYYVHYTCGNLIYLRVYSDLYFPVWMNNLFVKHEFIRIVTFSFH